MVSFPTHHHQNQLHFSLPSWALRPSLEPMTGFEPVTSSLPRKRSTPELHRPKSGAGDGTRTRNIQLGRLKLYQLSYSRLYLTDQLGWSCSIFKNEDLWGEQDSNLRRHSQQIYSLPSLAAWVSPRLNFKQKWAGRGIRTHDPEITNHVLWPTELCRQKSSFFM